MLWQLAGSLVGLSLAVSLVGTNPTSAPPSSTRLTLTNPYRTTMGGCGDCLQCIPPDPAFGHVWWQSGFGPTWGESHNECYIAPCDHPPCTPLGLNGSGDMPIIGVPSEVAAAEQAVLTGGLSAAQGAVDLLTLFPLRVELNHERSALQILSNCSPGRVVGHLPLAAAVIAEIDRRLQAQTD